MEQCRFRAERSREGFKYRSLTGFQKAVTQCIRKNVDTAALVIHGGTIMNIIGRICGQTQTVL